MPEDLNRTIQQELLAIRPLVELATNLVSQWNEKVEIVSDAPYRGLKPFTCHICIAEDTANSPLRWRTLIHEMLHSVSAGYNVVAYNSAQGYEEGVVEMLQRLLRPRILTALTGEYQSELWAEGDADHAFNSYIAILEEIRALRQQDTEEFYLLLLRTPLKERHALLVGDALKMPADSRRNLLMCLSRARAILEG